MNNSPLISVALATYNGSQFIREQLDSILTQTYPNIEVIIVDDCSTDNTIDILREYTEIYTNIQVYVNEQNMGVNQTFNKTLMLCRGDLIAICDQDDIWLPNKLMDSVEGIGEYSLVYSNSLLMDEYGKSLNRRKFKKEELYTGNDPRALSIFNNVAGHTIVLKSKLLKHVLPIPQHCHYDWWIAFVGANEGGVKFMREPYVIHRIHNNNVSKGIKCTSQTEGLIALRKWTNTMLAVENLKYKSYFLKLDSIQNVKNLSLKKLLLIKFQIQYRNVIFNNKGFWSTINRARKLNLPHIPD
jgi:glycosyltransferase involved in cell wall biosynthesis